MHFRKVVALLLVLVMSLGFVIALADGNEPIIKDEAGLLTEAEEEELRQVMLPICEYCTPLFWTTDENDNTAVESKAQVFLQSEIGDMDGVVFVIDMAIRRICVYSSANIYQHITSEVASNITGTIYQYAFQENYLECAKQAFNMILDELNPAGRTADTGNTLFFDWGIFKAESDHSYTESVEQLKKENEYLKELNDALKETIRRIAQVAGIDIGDMAEAVTETAEESKETVENAVSDMAELAEQLKKENESLKEQNDAMKNFIRDFAMAIGFDPETVAPKADETKDAVEGIAQINSNLASSSIEGTWKMTGMKSDKPEIAEHISETEFMLSNGLMESTSTFADGKVTVTTKYNVPGEENQEMTVHGTYIVDGNQLTVIEDGQKRGDLAEFKIDGDTLELITPEMSIMFVRID